MVAETVYKNENGRFSLMFDCIIACVLFFGADAFLEFTTDTYRTFAVGVGKKAKDMLVRNGRPVIYSMGAATALQILYYAVGNQHAMRICYTIGALPGAAMMHYFLLDVPGTDQNTESGRQEKSGKGVLSGINALAAVLLVVFLFGQYLSFQRVIIDRYKGNEADRLYIEAIGQAIREYEQESGTGITKVAVCQDAHVPDSWVEFTSDRYSRARSLNRTWSDIDSLNYYLGRKFKRADDNDAVKEQFAGKDWNAFSREQLVFEGDTLYLCVY